MDANKPGEVGIGGSGTKIEDNKGLIKPSSNLSSALLKWGNSFESVWKILKNGLLTALITFLVLGLIKEITTHSIIVERIHVPKTFEEKGLTSEIISLRVIDEMHLIHEEAWSAKKELSAFTYSQRTDIEVPGTKISIKSIANYFKDFFNLKNEIRISGELLLNDSKTFDTTISQDEAPNKYAIRLRVQGRTKTENFDIAESDMNTLLYVAAQKITSITDPVVYATHQFFELRSIHGRHALKKIITSYSNHASEELKAWAIYFEGSLLERDGNYSGAERKFIRAIELNPQLMDAYIDAAYLYMTMGNYHEAKNILTKGINKIKDNRLKARIHLRWSQVFESQYDSTRSYKNDSKSESNSDLVSTSSNIAYLGKDNKRNPVRSKEGFLDDALKSCDAAILLDHDSSRAHAYKGYYHYKKGMAQKGREEFQFALQLGASNKFNVYNDWGWAILSQSDLSADIIDESIQKFQEAQRFRPNSVDSLINLGTAYFYKSKYAVGDNKKESFEAGEKIFNEAIEKYHDRNYVYSEWGNALNNINRVDLAIEKFREASIEKPENARYRISLGAALYNQGLTEQAEQVFTEGLKYNPSNADYYNWWGYTLLKMGKLEDALVKYREAIHINPRFATYYANLGEVLYKTNKLKEAEQAYAKAIEIEPGNADYYNWRGFLWYSMENWTEAVKYYQQAININPEHAVYHSNLGQALYKNKQFKEAEQVFGKALEIGTDDASTYNIWGNSLYSLEKWSDAVKYYREAVTLAPEVAVYFSNLGGALYKNNQYREAEQAYAKAAELEPENAEYYNWRGFLWYSMENWTEAAKYYQQAIGINPDVAVYHSNLGQVLYQTNQFEEAEQEYTKAIGLEPENPGYYNWRGNCLYSMENWNEAAKYYQQAISINPEVAVYYSNLGLVLYQTNQFKEAEQAYATAAELAPENADYHNRHGNCFYSMGKWVEAAELYRKAISIDPNNYLYEDNLDKATSRAAQTMDNHVKIE